MSLVGVVNASDQETWTNYTNASTIRDIAVQGEYIWCATAGGLVLWDTKNMS